MADSKEILVIGGTGAQGMPIIKTLAETGRYRIRVLTRSLESSRAKQLAALQNVTLIQGAQGNQQDLHKAFRGVYKAAAPSSVCGSSQASGEAASTPHRYSLATYL